jgi:hypothetical protein
MAPRLHVAVERAHQIVVYRHRHALHGQAPQKRRAEKAPAKLLRQRASAANRPAAAQSSDGAGDGA